MLWDTVLAETRLEQWWWSWRQWQGREIGCRRPQGWEAEMKIFAVRRPRKHGLGGERKNPRKSYEAGVACTGVTTGGSRSKFTLRNVPDSNSGSSIEKDVMSLSFCFISSSSAGRPEQHCVCAGGNGVPTSGCEWERMWYCSTFLHHSTAEEGNPPPFNQAYLATKLDSKQIEIANVWGFGTALRVFFNLSAGKKVETKKERRGECHCRGGSDVMPLEVPGNHTTKAKIVSRKPTLTLTTGTQTGRDRDRECARKEGQSQRQRQRQREREKGNLLFEIRTPQSGWKIPESTQEPHVAALTGATQ